MKNCKEGVLRGKAGDPWGCEERCLEQLQNRIEAVAKGVGASTSGGESEGAGRGSRRDQKGAEEGGHLPRSCAISGTCPRAGKKII